MAHYFEPTEEQVAEWTQWVEARPPTVRTIAERFFPWELYRLGSSGHRCTLVAIDEQESGRVSLKVSVDGRFNMVAFERVVFGIDPDDLMPCALPGPDEPVGSANLSIEQVKTMIPSEEHFE